MDKDKQLAAPPPTPEIDPELAAMEAGTAPRESMTERLLRTVLNRREAKGTPTQGPKAGEKGVRDSRRERGQGRTTRRAMERYKGTPDRKTQPHARLGRGKPVKSQAQLASEYRQVLRSQLSRIKITMLLAECPEVKFVCGVPGLRNVWQLSRATTEFIHAVPGLGPARRKKIKAYLQSKQVPVAWEA